jgi:hypothetical protein
MASTVDGEEEAANYTVILHGEIEANMAES